MITRKEAWDFLVDRARKTNAKMTQHQDQLCLKRSRRRKKNRMGTKRFRKIKYKYNSSNRKLGTHVYEEHEEGTGLLGKVVLGRNDKGQVDIIASYVIFPPPKIEPPVKVTKVRKSGAGFRWVSQG